MRDEEYRPDQIPDYGLVAQPALVERMTPHLRLTQTGVGLAVLALVCAVVGLVTFPRFPGVTRTDPVVGLVCAVLVLAITGFQLFCWRRAITEWRGVTDYDLQALVRPSYVAHLASYVVVLVALWVGIQGSSQAGWTATSAVFLTLSLFGLVAAQICGGVQYLRASGPPGTVPAHMRSLVRRANRATGRG